MLDDLFRQIKSHRGQGLVEKMYDFYRQELSGRYTYLITDVVDQNQRSVKAHLKAGLRLLEFWTMGGAGSK